MTTPYYDSKLQVNIHKDIGTKFYVDVQPYVYRDINSGITGRAGAKADVGVHLGTIDLEVQHESVHTLDVGTAYPGAYELDSVNLIWHLN